MTARPSPTPALHYRVQLHDLHAHLFAVTLTGRAIDLVKRAGERRPQLIALPESFLYRGPAAGFRESASELPGPMTEPFAEQARSLDAWILLGSVAEHNARANEQSYYAPPSRVANAPTVNDAPAAPAAPRMQDSGGASYRPAGNSSMSGANSLFGR